jgi:hypothetical protein
MSPVLEVLAALVRAFATRRRRRIQLPLRWGSLILEPEGSEEVRVTHVAPTGGRASWGVMTRPQLARRLLRLIEAEDAGPLD